MGKESKQFKIKLSIVRVEAIDKPNIASIDLRYIFQEKYATKHGRVGHSLLI